MTTAMVAQNSAVTNASLSLKDATGAMASEDYEAAAKALAEAAGFIEPATTHEKTMGKEKTWRYRGDIYQLISRNLDKEAFMAIDDNPVGKAAQSYQKALELDTKGSYEKENKQGVAVMQNLAVNAGINMFNESKYAQAFNLFEQGASLAEALGVTDTLALYNAALSADRGEDHANAVKYYKRAIDLDYGGSQLFVLMRAVYDRMGDAEGASQALTAGLEKFPSDQGLLIEKVNELFDANDMAGAESVLEKTVAQDPENALLQYNVGLVYDNLGKQEQAREAYQKALVLDPGYFDSNYSMGASYYNEAVGIVGSCNEIAANKIKEYEACMASATLLFDKALPFLETAHETDPADKSTIASLIEIYSRTKQLEKASALRSKLGG